MKSRRLFLIICIVLLTTVSAMAQRATTSAGSARIFEVKSSDPPARDEKVTDAESLRRRRKILQSYILTLSPASKDYGVTESEIKEIDVKLAELEKAAANSTSLYDSIPVTDSVRVAPPVAQDQVEDVFVDFFATLAANCPPPAKGPADNFEITYGYNQKFRPREGGSRSQKGPFSFSYFPSSRFLFTIGMDTFTSKVSETDERVTGVGNMSLGFSYDAAPEDKNPIPISIYYSLTIPVASVSKGLGRGRFDHLFLATTAKTFGSKVECGTAKKNKFAIDYGAFMVGRAGADGYSTIGLLNVIYERRFGLLGKHRFHIEVDGSSRAGAIKAEIFALGWLKFKTSKYTSLRVGSQAGITPNSPRFGFFARFGINGNLGKVFKTE